MGTTLTGTTPQDTYDSLIKVTDNGPLSGTAKYLSDGLGNDSVLALSNARVGIGTNTPSTNLDVAGEIKLSSDLYMGNNRFIRFERNSGSTSIQTLGIPTGTDDVRLLTTGDFNVVTGGLVSLLAVKSTGNVGIGNSSPINQLDLNKTGAPSLFDAGLDVVQNGGTIELNYIAAGRSGGRDGAHIFKTGLTTGGTEIARFTTNGLTFNGDTAAANALDDYEEGTWTMGISFGGASTGITYQINTGTYTKIGRQVTVQGYLTLSSKGSASGDARITGLPFTILNNAAAYSAVTMWLNRISFENQFQAYGVIGSTVVAIDEITEAGAYSSLTNADFQNTSEVILTMSYIV